MYVRDPLGSLCERLRESLYPLQQKHWKKPAGQGILNTLTSKKWGGVSELAIQSTDQSRLRLEYRMGGLVVGRRLAGLSFNS